MTRPVANGGGSNQTLSELTKRRDRLIEQVKDLSKFGGPGSGAEAAERSRLTEEISQLKRAIEQTRKTGWGDND